MPGVSQGLVDFANNLRQQAGPGVEVIEDAELLQVSAKVFVVTLSNWQQ